jgi:hypothetical protein
LRTRRGIDLDQIRREYGGTAVFDEVAVDGFIASGHLLRRENRLQPTPTGMAIADGLVRSITNESRRPPVR